LSSAKGGEYGVALHADITLTSENRIGHPYEHHPVSGTPDPLTGGEMSCISCHPPHGAGKLHLLKMASEIPEDALNRTPRPMIFAANTHAAVGLGWEHGK
jgi:predicted CXXCH cytochrome family protein